MNTQPILAAIAVLATHAAGADDFESYDPGPVPAGEWRDVADRIDDPSGGAPTARVVETTDAHGKPTKAVAITNAIGTSSGIYRAIDPADHYSVTVDVRIDGLSDAEGHGVWPVAIGFAQSGDNGDINADPHAVVYAWGDRRFYLFVRQEHKPGANIGLPGDKFEFGTWYTVSLEIDATSGVMSVSIVETASGDPLASKEVQLKGWDREFARYDAVAFYDGEYNSTNGTFGGQATIDNVR